MPSDVGRLFVAVVSAGAHGRKKHVKEKVATEGAKDLLWAAVEILSRGEVGEEFAKAGVNIFDEPLIGFQGLGGVGFLELVNDGDFLEGFVFDFGRFVGVIENRFELDLFGFENFGGYGVDVMLKDPVEVADEIGMRLKPDIDSGRQVSGADGFNGWVGQEPGNVEQSRVLGEGGFLASEGELPKAVFIFQGKRFRRRRNLFGLRWGWDTLPLSGKRRNMCLRRVMGWDARSALDVHFFITGRRNKSVFHFRTFLFVFDRWLHVTGLYLAGVIRLEGV